MLYSRYPSDEVNAPPAHNASRSELYDPRDAIIPYGYLAPVVRDLDASLEYWRDRLSPDA